MKHEMWELQQMQSLGLESKVRMTETRIKGWVQEYGEDGVYVSFSGGKDSCVLLDIARNIYPDMKAVFVDTGLEYPEIREFVKTFDNVDWIKPKMNFRQVIEKYGYPFISKEVSECVYGAKRYLDQVAEGKENPSYLYEFQKLNAQGKYGERPEKKHDQYVQRLNGTYEQEGAKEGSNNEDASEGTPKTNLSQYNCKRYQFFLEDGAPPISNMCCSVMKKKPVHNYAKETGRNPITAQLAGESRLRTEKWLLHGCNGFDLKSPISNPMSFWLEQDVLLYIYEHHLPICSVYGDVVEDYEAEGEVEGQMDFSDYGIFEKSRKILKTTGCERTGCMFCGFGCHLEKSPSRFEKMKETHPKQYEYIMKPWDEGGLGYKEVIDWINEHGNLDIKY